MVAPETSFIPEYPDGDTHMPLLAHLVELRRRLIWSLIAFILAFAGCLVFAADIFNILALPLQHVTSNGAPTTLIYTALPEKFITDMKLALFAAGFVSFPVVATQVWMFVAPGLYKNERGAFLPFLFATPILFTLGACLAYFYVMPVAWQFFAGYQQQGGGVVPVEMTPRVSEYLGLVMGFIFAFGAAFQMPVLLLLLVRAGLVSARQLARSRRYAIVLIFIVAAILTPPDVVSQSMLAVPMLLLFEISLFLARLIEKKQIIPLDETAPVEP